MGNLYTVNVFCNPDLFASNLYVLESDFGNLVIDPSFYDGDVKKKLSELKIIDGILITHGHADHIRCIDDVVNDFPNTKVYIHKDEVEMISDPFLNCSRRVGNYDIIVKSNMTYIAEGELNIGSHKIQIFNFQGHTYGSVMYYFPALKIMFLGDVIMTDCVGTTRVPTGDIELLKKSIQNFKNLNILDDVVCYPGHGDSMTLGDIKKNNPFLSF